MATGYWVSLSEMWTSVWQVRLRRCFLAPLGCQRFHLKRLYCVPVVYYLHGNERFIKNWDFNPDFTSHLLTQLLFPIAKMTFAHSLHRISICSRVPCTEVPKPVSEVWLTWKRTGAFRNINRCVEVCQWWKWYFVVAKSNTFTQVFNIGFCW